MRAPKPLLTLIVTLLFGGLPSATAAELKRSPAIDRGFTTPQFALPTGYTIELVAGPPLVHHPIMAGFDERGRLFVSETVGLNLRNLELDEQLPNHVTLLEDDNGDGFFDKSTRFADKMTFPQGAQWYDGALYVSSPPGLWKLEDLDNDGVAEKRTQLADGFAYTGNAADVHGPFLHPNGRLYWCHGRKGHEVYQNDGKSLVSKGKGARIWSCLPDGSDIQVHAGGGMDNPTELTFTPEGDILGSVNLFYGRPRGDTLVHWLYGGAYPRHDQQAVTAEFKRTGELLKEVHNFGHVAVSGLCRYRSDTLGNEFRGNIFQTFFNTHKVQRVELHREGGSFTAKVHDFLETAATDVHFTDVLEDADGSLLVIDTGGWFRIGCPTSQLAKPDVHGAIYRIRRTISVPPKDPRGNKIDWSNLDDIGLAQLLSDRRFAVRDRAREALVKHGTADSVVALVRAYSQGGERMRRNAIWALSRIQRPEARATLWSGLDDPAASIRISACIALAGLKDRAAVSKLVERLEDDDIDVRREAATALGRIGDPAAASFLIRQLQQPMPRALEHAVLYALIQLDQAELVVLTLRHSRNERARSLAMIVGDQMDSSPLTRGLVLPHIDSPSEHLASVATDIVRAKTDWAPDAAKRFAGWFDRKEVSESRARALKQVLSTHIAEQPARDLITRLLNWPDDLGPIYNLATEIIAAATGPKTDPNWITALNAGLKSKGASKVDASLAAIGVLKDRQFDDPLKAFGNDPGKPRIQRVKALAAISSKSGRLDSQAFELITALLSPQASIKDRSAAADLIAKARLTSVQTRALAPLAAHLGAIELPTFMQAFQRTRDLETGKLLVAALVNAPGLGNLNVAELKRTITRFPPEVSGAAEGFLEELSKQNENQAAKLDEILAALPTGNFLAGKKVFESQTALCAVCHRIDGNGGLVGPDLSHIGAIRTRRDLLESIIFPSASLARDFEAYSVDTTDDESHTGVLFRDEQDVVELAVANGERIRIPRTQVSSIRPSSLSLMPQGLDQTMTRQQLADLVNYLLNLK